MKFTFYIFRAFLILGLLSHTPVATSKPSSEFHIKASFIYNFIAFTRWSGDAGTTINLCLYGDNPVVFEKEIKKLGEKSVNGRQIVIQNKNQIEDLDNCQVVIVTYLPNENLLQVIDYVSDKPILTIASIPYMEQLGVIINMSMKNNNIEFKIDLKAATRAGLGISSKLLQLATEVHR